MFNPIILKVSNSGVVNNSNQNNNGSGNNNPPPPAASREFLTAPVAGFGGVVSVEQSVLRHDSSGGAVDIYVSRLDGNSGQITLTWEMYDGSMLLANAVDGYNALSKTITFEDGEYGFKSVRIPLQGFVLNRTENLAFKIVSAAIDNAAPFYLDQFAVTHIRFDNNTIVEADRLYMEVGNPAASDNNVGSETQPFATLQKLYTECAIQNKRGYILSGDGSPIVETGLIDDNNVAGGGAINRPVGAGANFSDFLFIDGLDNTGNRIVTPHQNVPLIDNSYANADGDATKATAATLITPDTHSVWLADFEGTGVGQGIKTSGNAHNIVCERLNMHHVIGNGNLGSFQFDGAVESVIHNCKGGYNYDNRVTNLGNPKNDPELSAGVVNGQTVTNRMNWFQSFAVDKVVIEYSEMEHCGRMVYMKEQQGKAAAPNQEAYHVQSVWARNNVIKDGTSSGYDSHNQGTRQGAQNIAFYHNVVDDCLGFVSCQETIFTEVQAEGVYCFGNTGSVVDGGIGALGADGIHYANNVIDTPNPDLANNTPQVINLIRDLGAGSSRITRMHKCKHNVYANFAGFEFNTNKDAVPSTDEIQHFTLASFQTALDDDASGIVALFYSIDGTPATAFNPEQGSIDEPGNVLTNPADNDYSLNDVYLHELGAGSVGAYFDDSVVVGNY